ncbi:M6 family metalloprotease domain-containing protein [Actinoplanes sp. TBRC 11911]|uniref:M6 family metalloprotease domain-containing protein n=1 Tax=Actinoplanes sp. TBRC 11911 TaxID=2729386 RepID=UPI00145CEDA7|nr:M6 family metalloprotease domain-containing protein [Actinoplanes sp. TBRC 11911]NMO52461.1 M6 family metalloprotease domain-containing protein [Actinoplanes sp. TBRC 11911]
MRLTKRLLAAAAASLVTIGVCTLPGAPASAAPDPASGPFKVLDPQNWENPDDMTTADFTAPPGTDWANPSVRGSVRNFNIALVTLDYPDEPFVVTQRARSTIFGNPQPSASGLSKDAVPGFYRDLLNKPQTLNGGHTMHEYWMEDSGGRYGVDLTSFGVYTLPSKSYQYGITNDMNPGMCPPADTCNKNIRTDGLALWRNAVGAEEAAKYELVFILSAGQDESSTWQEFGEMKFNKDAIPENFGPPDATMPNYAKTRYVDWTSWASASTIWPNAGGGSSTQAESSGMGTYAHELSHLLSIGDNYNNPFSVPARRDYTGPFSMMSRGSFNGPGGPHTRWQIPSVQGGSMGSLHTLRDKAKIGLVDEKNVLRLSREALAGSGLIVAKITSRAVDPGNGLMGVNVAMNADRETPCNVNEDPMCDGGNFNNYTLEVIDRMGADSYQPDHGVMISKTKNADSAPFQWTIDANPQDLNLIDFYRPDGTAQKITIGDYRQLSDALFHAGSRSGSEYEYTDTQNRLHFYILDMQRDKEGVLSYTVAIQSLDGAGGPSTHGVALSNGSVATDGQPTKKGVSCAFDLTNTGVYSSGGQAHPEDATKFLTSDVYRLSSTVTGNGWQAVLPNALATAKFGGTAKVKVAVAATASASNAGVVHLTATSVSDPSKTVTKTCRVTK